MTTTEPFSVQDEPWWLPPCRDAIQQMGAKMCDEVHCTEAEQQNHDICYCNPPYLDGCKKLGHPSPDCCSYDATSPVFVSGPNPCYCCCGCFASDTMVATSRQAAKAIREFAIGDEVWVAMDADLKTWDTAPVAFSSGTGETPHLNTLIRVRFGDKHKPGSVYANRDQLFLMDDHKLKRCARLVPGKDSLLRPDGTTLPVLDLTAGKYNKGVHHIATTATPSRELAGHLIVANGLVAGDYALQLKDLDRAAPELMVEGHAQMPELGTPEYAAAHPHLTHDAGFAHVEGVDPRDADPQFKPFVASAVEVPEDARSFVTEDQAKDIQANGKRHPSYSDSAKPMVDYLFSLFGGFNPGVVFHYDAGNDLPNAYAFRQFDVLFVVLNGGLARTEVLSLEGIALVLAQALGHLYGGDPKNSQGYSCTGVADFAATAANLPEAFFGQRSTPVVEAGLAQIETLFDLIDLDHRGGRPGDRCTYISIDCRQAALRAGFESQPLPECAGGPSTATLEVVGASAAAGPEGPQVTVTFNEPVDPATGGEVGAYDFAPVAPATAAKVSSDAKSVTIDVQIEAGTQYTVRAVEVTSASGHPIVPGHDSAQFTLAPVS